MSVLVFHMNVLVDVKRRRGRLRTSHIARPRRRPASLNRMVCDVSVRCAKSRAHHPEAPCKESVVVATRVQELTNRQGT